MSPKLDKEVLTNVFGSDLEQSEADESSPASNENPARAPSFRQKTPQTPRKAPVMPESDSDEEIASTPLSSRRPVTLPDSDDDDEPAPRRKRRRTRTSRSPTNVKSRKGSKDHCSNYDEEVLEHETVNRRPNAKRKRQGSTAKRANRGRQSKKERKSVYVAKTDEEDAPALKKPKTVLLEVVEEARARRRPQKEVDVHKIEVQCIDFLSSMIQAMNEDLEAYKSGKPALQKLQMLRDVEEMSTKVQCKEPLLENNFLAVIKTWLDPYPDGVLPNVQIRKSLLNILADIPINEELIDRLNTSRGIGFAIHYLSAKDDHGPTKRAAEKLMQRWFRLITKTSDRLNVFSDDLESPDNNRVVRGSTFSADKQVEKTALEELQAKRDRLLSRNAENEQVFAAVPRTGKCLYDAIPEANEDIGRQRVKRKRRSSGRKNDDNQEDGGGISRKLARLRQSNKNQKLSKPSVNGR